jgi:hypothetical protein
MVCAWARATPGHDPLATARERRANRRPGWVPRDAVPGSLPGRALSRACGKGLRRRCRLYSVYRWGTLPAADGRGWLRSASSEPLHSRHPSPSSRDAIRRLASITPVLDAIVLILGYLLGHTTLALPRPVRCNLDLRPSSGLSSALTRKPVLRPPRLTSAGSRPLTGIRDSSARSHPSPLRQRALWTRRLCAHAVI